jgi:hypothetical protein
MIGLPFQGKHAQRRQLCLIMVCLWMLCAFIPLWRCLGGGPSKGCRTYFFAGRVDQNEMACVSKVYNGCFMLLKKWWVTTVLKKSAII